MFITNNVYKLFLANKLIPKECSHTNKEIYTCVFSVYSKHNNFNIIWNYVLRIHFYEYKI